MITLDRLKEMLSYDHETGVFTWIVKPRRSVKLGSIAGSENKGYNRIRLDKRGYPAHRLAWLYYYGEWPKNGIDHIDGNRSNNKILNLRDIPHRNNIENIMRAHKNKKSGLPLGVTFNSRVSTNKYRAGIETNGKQISLGAYPTPEEAHQAYVKAKRMLHKGCTI